MMPDWVEKMVDKHWITPQIFDTSFPHIPKRTEFNRSLFDSTILVNNDGSESLEHWKLMLMLPDTIVTATDINYEKKGHYDIISNVRNIYYNTSIDIENHLIEIEPRKKILVGDDTFSSEPIFLKPVPEEATIEITWKLVSKNFKHEGALTVHVVPEIHIERVSVADNSTLTNNDQSEHIEDYLESIDDD